MSRQQITTAYWTPWCKSAFTLCSSSTVVVQRDLILHTTYFLAVLYSARVPTECSCVGAGALCSLGSVPMLLQWPVVECIQDLCWLAWPGSCVRNVVWNQWSVVSALSQCMFASLFNCNTDPLPFLGITCTCQAKLPLIPVTPAGASQYQGPAISVSHGNRLVGLVVKVSALRVEDPGFKSRLRRDFFWGGGGSSHTSDLKLALQWLPCQVPGIGSALGLVDPVSVYCV